MVPQVRIDNRATEMRRNPNFSYVQLTVVLVVIAIGLATVLAIIYTPKAGSSKSPTTTVFDGDVEITGNLDVATINGKTTDEFGNFAPPTDESIKKVYKVDAVAWISNTNITIFNDTAGPGFITMIHISLAGLTGNATAEMATDSYINFEIDDYREQASLGAFMMTKTGPTFMSTDALGITASTGANVGGYRKVFIPYTKKCAIVLSNTVITASSTLYIQIYYSSGEAPQHLTGTRRFKWHAGFMKDVTVAQYAPTTFLTHTGMGQIESVYLSIVGSSGLGSLEGNPTYDIDGVAAAYEATGTDDYFGGQFYWNPSGSTVLYTRTNKWGLLTQATSACAAYRFHGEADPINWDKSITYKWYNGQASQGSAPGSVVSTSLVTYWTAE